MVKEKGLHEKNSDGPIEKTSILWVDRRGRGRYSTGSAQAKSPEEKRIHCAGRGGKYRSGAEGDTYKHRKGPETSS